MRKLRLAYLVEDTAQSGGVRVILAQADELVARGHHVRIVTKGGPVTWRRRTAAEWIHVASFDEYDASGDDFVIGTFWLTVPEAFKIGGPRAVHLSQGYEGAFSFNRSVRDQIDDIYRLPVPKLVVARSLVDVCRQFTDDVTYIGQVVEDEFYRSSAPPENDPLRVLLAGPAQADLKGIADGYSAVLAARESGARFTLIRVSPWLPAADEPTEIADEFHVGLPAADMTALMHSCDVLLAPNHAEEGFGLPAAEAMASRIACVLTDIPSYQSFDRVHDYGAFAPQRNPRQLGEALLNVLRDRDLRRHLRQRGREVAEQFRASVVAERMEQFFRRRAASNHGS